MESKLQVQVKMYCSEDGSSYQVNMKFIYLLIYFIFLKYQPKTIAWIM